MIIDFHNHYYPPEYLAELRNGSSRYRITDDSDGNPVLHSPGDYNIVVPGHRDASFRTEVLDAAGVNKQVVTFTAPGTAMETPERASELCVIVNNALAGVVADYPGRYASLATLPMQDPGAAVAEFVRARTELGMPGAMLFSNASGVALSDERFWPLYEVANDTESVLYIHPTYPIGVEAMTDYMLMPMVGFLMDTTLATASLIYAGVAERFPKIRWVLAHLGGAVPYLAERFDRGYEAYPECRANISTPPSEQLKRFYYDTVNFNPKALAFTIEFAGVDRILAGSDYPHQIGSLDKMISSLQEVELSSEERAKIFGGNAAKLLGL